MTDMERVAGILDWENWRRPGAAYYELGKELLAGEENAAVEGFLAGGASEPLTKNIGPTLGANPHTSTGFRPN